MSSYKQPIKAVIFVACILIAFIYYAYMDISPSNHKYSLFYREHSPDKKFSLEYYKINDFFIGELLIDDPGFIRAFDRYGDIIYESNIFSTNTGGMKTMWPLAGDNQILVGTSISIDVSTIK